VDQQTSKKLRDNYDDLKSELQARFPGVQDSDLQKLKTDPDGFVDAAAQSTGQSKEQVQESLKQVVQTA